MIYLIPASGAAVLFYAWIQQNPAVRFTHKALIPCLFIQAASILAVVGVLSWIMPFDVSAEGYGDIPAWRVIAAGLEDALFILPAFIIPKPWRYGFLALSAISFTSGHAYQGAVPALAKVPYVFVGYILAARFGILTTIAAHSINDLAGWLVISAAGLR